MGTWTRGARFALLIIIFSKISLEMSRREWVLRKESELRCLVRGDNRVITVRLIEGHAELFGAELAKGKDYHIRDQNVAIFTWYGCTLETIATGDLSPESMYEADTTPMMAYMNIHQQLEARRDVALANGDNGPHILVVGPQDHGKTTLARMLTTYAARLDRNPIYVDLDINAGLAGVPGSISALPIEKTNVSVEVRTITS
jgi:polyribonucleotide 5'-hydroxyl-kinase